MIYDAFTIYLFQMEVWMSKCLLSYLHQLSACGSVFLLQRMLSLFWWDHKEEISQLIKHIWKASQSLQEEKQIKWLEIFWGWLHFIIFIPWYPFVLISTICLPQITFFFLLVPMYKSITFIVHCCSFLSSLDSIGISSSWINIHTRICGWFHTKMSSNEDGD